jgi:hypothetical protein
MSHPIDATRRGTLSSLEQCALERRDRMEQRALERRMPCRELAGTAHDGGNMAKTSSAASDKQRTGAARGGERQANDARGGGRSIEAPHGETDENYALVSILYHALQGAETYSQYITDAEDAGDQEIADFVRSCHDEEVLRAQRAKSLLAARLSDLDEDDDEED